MSVLGTFEFKPLPFHEPFELPDGTVADPNLDKVLQDAVKLRGKEIFSAKIAGATPTRKT